jgi:hypothetical protein
MLLILLNNHYYLFPKYLVSYNDYFSLAINIMLLEVFYSSNLLLVVNQYILFVGK